MSFALKQTLLITAGGVFVGGAAWMLARRELMSLRYALGWTAIAAITVAGAILTRFVEPIAHVFGMTPTGVLLGGATVVLLGITMQLSVSVSGLQRQLRDVAEAHALLARRLEEHDEAAKT